MIFYGAGLILLSFAMVLSRADHRVVELLVILVVDRWLSA